MHKMALPIGAKYTDVYIPIKGASIKVRSKEIGGEYCIEVEVATDNKESSEFNYKFDVSDNAIKVPFYAISAPEAEHKSPVFEFKYAPAELGSNKIDIKVEILSPFGGTKAKLHEIYTIKH